MKQFYGTSKRGVLKEATTGLTNPALIILLSGKEQFPDYVKELEELYPGVPSIGCVGMSYNSSEVLEQGVGVYAFTEGISVVTNVIEEASTIPLKYISRLEDDLKKVNAAQKDTVCIDFCTGNDACMLTTIYSVLDKQKISLMGGTADASMVSVNGNVYHDAAVYAIVKNRGGRVKVYKENVYQPMEGYRFIASKTDRAKYILGELNGRPAKQVYEEELHIKENDIVAQTFKNPLGKMNGDDICIISVKEVVGNSLACYRQVNDSDVLTLLELKDYRQTTRDTVQKIKTDFPHISGVFSVNCVFRYLLFQQENYVNEYLKTMGVLENHVGFIGYGEHCNSQFVNQTMTCVVFE